MSEDYEEAASIMKQNTSFVYLVPNAIILSDRCSL